MILIDYREENATKRAANLDLKRHIERLGVKVEVTDLQFGDAAFEMRGPNGPLMVGIERKGIHDMLSCIDDSRYNAQRIGMKSMYDISVLMLEGHWKPHDPEGILMEGFSGGISWGYARPRGARVMYSKLYRYLISVTLSGVIITYSRDPFHTAFNIVEWYQYGQKRDHTSLLEIQKVAIPTLNRKPSLLRKWANDLDGIGTKMSELAERNFRSALELANADESEWLRIPGVGVKTAQSIVGEIWRKR